MMGRKDMGIIRSHCVIHEQGKIVEARVKVKPEESVERALKLIGA